MQVVVTKEIKSSYTGKVLKTQKVINPELCVNTMEIARRQSELARNEHNDCVVRAFMALFDITYDSSHAWVKKNFKRVNRQGTYTMAHLKGVIGKTKNSKRLSFYGASPSHSLLIKGKNIRSATKQNRVLLNPKYKKPTSYTLRSFIENHPTGRYFVIVEGHAVSVIEGKLYGNLREGEYKINRRVHYVLKAS